MLKIEFGDPTAKVGESEEAAVSEGSHEPPQPNEEAESEGAAKTHEAAEPDRAVES